MSTETIAIIIVVVIILFLIGNFSTVQKSAKNPMRTQGLNDLKETLPRTNKTKHQLPTVDKKR